MDEKLAKIEELVEMNAYQKTNNLYKYKDIVRFVRD